MLENNINLTNPNDPKTKKFLQDLDTAIVQHVIALTEMHKNMCQLQLAKTKEEKINEFLAERKHLDEIEARLKENAKIISQTTETKLAPGTMEKLLEIKKQLGEMEKVLVQKIKSTEDKIQHLDIQIESSKSNIEKLVEKIDADHQEIVTSVKDEVKGQKIKDLNNEEITLSDEHLNFETPSFEEFSKDETVKTFMSSDTINEYSVADKLSHYLAENICRTIFMQANPAAKSAEHYISMSLNNPEFCQLVKHRINAKFQEHCQKDLLTLVKENVKLAVMQNDRLDAAEILTVLKTDLANVIDQQQALEKIINKYPNENKPAASTPSNESRPESPASKPSTPTR